MTSSISLLNMPRAIVVAAALFALAAPAAAQSTHLPCPKDNNEIGAGTCPDAETGMKRVQPKDTDASNAEKAEPPAEVVVAENVGRDDKAAQDARAKQRKERIDLLAREAEMQLK